MNKTPIEWCDFTVNPFRFRNLSNGKVGHHCTKISPGCKNCYSSTMQAGPYLSGLTFIETNKPKGAFFLDEGVLQQVLRRKKACRIFWCDMTDMFLEDYPDEWIDRCFAVMALTPHLTHQVLTKRPERMREHFAAGETELLTRYAAAWDAMERSGTSIGQCTSLSEWPLPNVHLGVSVEDRQRKDRIEHLRATPAAVRFISFEPLLEDLGELDLLGIDLVIWGGESGANARPSDISWIRSGMKHAQRDGCLNFVKQLGANPQEIAYPNDVTTKEADTWIRAGWTWIHEAGLSHWRKYLRLKDRKGGNPEEWPADLRVREMPEVSR